jgi:hypothetical protein
VKDLAIVQDVYRLSWQEPARALARVAVFGGCANRQPASSFPTVDSLLGGQRHKQTLLPTQLVVSIVPVVTRSDDTTEIRIAANSLVFSCTPGTIAFAPTSTLMEPHA